MINLEAISSPETADLARYIDSCMQGEKLNIDAIRNCLVRVVFASSVGAKMLKPLLTYEQMIRQREPEKTDLFMVVSDSEAATSYDMLVGAFNADMERIQKEDDREAIINFSRKAQEISKG
jgi:hypothetical protein